MRRSKLIVVLAVLGAALVVPGSAQATRTFSPTSLSFPDTVVDKESAAQTVTYSINAAETYRTTNPYIGRGAGGACPPGGFCSFRFTTTCPVYPQTFPAGDQQCTFSVYFTPYLGGAESGELNSSVGEPTVALSGKGVNEQSGGGGKKKKKCKKKGKRGATAAKKKCGKKKK